MKTDGRRPVNPTSTRSTPTAALRAPLLWAAGVLVAWGYVAAVDPHVPGRYPVCPTLALLGIACPACGGLRSANSLAHGDVTAAVGHNALFVAAVPAALGWWLWWTARRLRGGSAVVVPRRLVAGLVTLAVVVTVVRNLGFGAALAP